MFHNQNIMKHRSHRRDFMKCGGGYTIKSQNIGIRKTYRLIRNIGVREIRGSEDRNG